MAAESAVARAKAWGFSACGQLLWITYGLITHQWGFIASGVVYWILNVRNMRRSLVFGAATGSTDVRAPKQELLNTRRTSFRADWLVINGSKLINRREGAGDD
jgi:hypothetical protein